MTDREAGIFLLRDHKIEGMPRVGIDRYLVRGATRLDRGAFARRNPFVLAAAEHLRRRRQPMLIRQIVAAGPYSRPRRSPVVLATEAR